jgi:hypothetical protein
VTIDGAPSKRPQHSGRMRLRVRALHLIGRGGEGGIRTHDQGRMSPVQASKSVPPSPPVSGSVPCKSVNNGPSPGRYERDSSHLSSRLTRRRPPARRLPFSTSTTSTPMRPFVRFGCRRRDLELDDPDNTRGCFGGGGVQSGRVVRLRFESTERTMEPHRPARRSIKRR